MAKKKTCAPEKYGLGIIITILGIIFSTVYTDIGFGPLGLAFIIIGLTFLFMGLKEMKKK